MSVVSWALLLGAVRLQVGGLGALAAGSAIEDVGVMSGVSVTEEIERRNAELASRSEGRAAIQPPPSRVRCLERRLQELVAKARRWEGRFGAG